MEDEEQILEDAKILSIFIKGSHIGAACYSVESGSLSALSDQRLDEPDRNCLRELIREISPHTILVSGQGELKGLIKNVLETDSLDSSELCGLPSSFYNYAEGKSRLHSLHFSFESLRPFRDEEHKRLYVSSVLHETSECGVRSTGALLRHLETQSAGPQALEIHSFTSFVLSKVLYMNKMTFEAFRVFEPSTRPSGSSAGNWNRSKEGLSLFGLFDRCRSSLGIKALRNFLRCPCSSLDDIQKRQRHIEFFHRPEAHDLIKNLRIHLKNIKNMNGVVKRVANFTASVQDWKNLQRSLTGLLGMGRLLQGHKLDIFNQISTHISEDLYSVSYFLENIFDVQESELKYRFVVKSGVDEELDDIRRKHNGLPDLLTSIAQLEVEDLGDLIQECSIIYLPRVGYMLAIKPSDINLPEEEIPSRFHPLDYLFQTHDTLHFKSDRCRELDAHFGDTDAEVKRIEFNIVHKLSTLVLSLEDVLRKLIEFAGRLDALICIALVSKDHGWVKPEMFEDPDRSFYIEMGRHPIQEQCVSVYVPNNTNYDSAKISVLTGPNGSGKSVYLKQVGTLVYLAHIGSWIPAGSAAIPLLSRIDTRIKSTESISLGLSAFAIDCHQMKSAMSSSSRNSLVLIDEFGKGTNDTEGEALLVASLESFASLGESCPYVLVTTHFLGALSLLYRHPGMSFLSMDYKTKNDSVFYFYKVVEGGSTPGGSSCAGAIAARVDVPSHILQRAGSLASRGSQDPFVYPLQWRNMIRSLEVFGRKISEMDFDEVSTEELIQILPESI